MPRNPRKRRRQKRSLKRRKKHPRTNKELRDDRCRENHNGKSLTE